MKKSVWLIEVFYRPKVFDAHAEEVKKSVEELGVGCVDRVSASSLYRIEGMIKREAIIRIARDLLADSVSQDYRLGEPFRQSAWSVQVWYKPGVTDTVAETARKAIQDLGISNCLVVSTGRCYFFWGKLQENILSSLARKLLANELIEYFLIKRPGK